MAVRENAQITKEHFEEAKRSAYALLDKLGDSIIYHRKEHTTNSVVPASLAIAEAEGFTSEDKFLVGIAAAFHDTGFVKKYNANEPFGALLAEDYMRVSRHAYSEEQIANVKDAIENTNMKSPPKTKYARVLRDSDLSYIGEDSAKFLQWIRDLKEEASLHPESPLHIASRGEKSWGISSYNFITKFHSWFTDGARSLYEQGKKKNIASLKTHYRLE